MPKLKAHNVNLGTATPKNCSFKITVVLNQAVFRQLEVGCVASI